IDAHDLSKEVALAPYLSEDSFHRAMAEAAVVVLPSDLEGFGLPVLEGMALGKPVVIGPDPGAVEVAGGHAAMMEGWTADALADSVVTAVAK
ncbi:glycosyltransferase, partial [Streptobacillus moniliformis]|uniref:glycosyltransferase n=1 Tax=Streptobacillus moniliformis TaxID=34105 RepID=UPI000AA6B4D1